MKSCLGILLFVVVGCAHNSGRETVQFPYAADLVREIQRNAQNRAPAQNPLEVDVAKSTRRVYFSSLYHQYVTLAEHLKRKNKLSFCPQFHHDKVEADALTVPAMTRFKEDAVEEEGKEYFPELAFNKNFSLGRYHTMIKEELEVLCEEGYSDNFYKFDNLVTHYAEKKSFHLKPEAMESVLKIPIFANFYLIKMLAPNHAMANSSPDEDLFIKMTATHWFGAYVQEAGRLRVNFVRNKMVQR